MKNCCVLFIFLWPTNFVYADTPEPNGDNPVEYLVSKDSMVIGVKLGACT